MLDTHALGRVVPGVIASVGPHGARLRLESGAADQDTVLLPRREVPVGAAPGQRLDVFVYQDSDDRPVATLATPKLMLDEVAFLPVVDVTRFGAFFDWGLPKQLLVPHAEQTVELSVGDRHPIGLYVDDTDRLAGTMRVSEMLRSKPRCSVGDWVPGEAWRRDPDIGVFVILERRFVGLLPVSEPHRLGRGEPGRFRVSHVHADGRVELSLRDVAHREVDGDAEKILAVLEARPGTRVGDHSSPEHITSLFGLSKKAFKRAVGSLFRQGRVTIDEDGFVALAPR
jgi:hypothetical protein